MKTVSLFGLSIIVGLPLWGQNTNYVATTANTSSPGSYNILVGPLAGSFNSGSNNSFLGYQAGNKNTSGSLNSFVGTNAGYYNTTGGYNSFVGVAAGFSNTVGGYNSFIGSYAGYANTNGSYNSFVGHQAGYYNNTGDNNSFMGYQAGYKNTGFYNSFMGSQAGYSNTSAKHNSFIGYAAGSANTTGNYNSLVGSSSGINNTTGNNNSFVGYAAGYFSTTGSQNNFIGVLAGYYNSTGSGNNFVGYQAGIKNDIGYSNIAIGTYASFANTTGHNNVTVGDSAGLNNLASGNLFVGSKSGFNNTTAANNTALGTKSGLKTTTGSDNVSVGYNSGLENTTGKRNTFVGNEAGVSSSNPNLQNATAIGYGARVSASNSMVLGAGVNVGIGNTEPGNKLEITQGTAGNSGLRFTNLTSVSPATVLNQTKFLTVNASGDVLLGSLNSSARVGTELWEAKGEQLLNTNTGSIVIGKGVSKTPAGYKLYVEQGILTEKVKVAVKNTADWSDQVFDTGYELKSLQEVERYINANQHLPGIPSAQEMVERGNDLHKTDAKLLEKIEELTLYSIQLEKSSQQQESRLQQVGKDKQHQQTEIDDLKRLVKQLLTKK